MLSIAARFAPSFIDRYASDQRRRVVPAARSGAGAIA